MLDISREGDWLNTRNHIFPHWLGICLGKVIIFPNLRNPVSIFPPLSFPSGFLSCAGCMGFFIHKFQVCKKYILKNERLNSKSCQDNQLSFSPFKITYSKSSTRFEELFPWPFVKSYDKLDVKLGTLKMAHMSPEYF